MTTRTIFRPVAAFLASLVMLSILLVRPALAEVTFLNNWGGIGSGEGQVNGPTDVAVGPTGQVYVVDSWNDRVQRFDAVGNYLGQWGSIGIGDGQFDNPEGVAVGPTGQVYVTDKLVVTGNARVQRFDAVGNYETQWDLEGGSGPFDEPTGVAVVPTGQVYVTEWQNHRVQRFFDSDAWVSGTNTFVDGTVGPTSVGVGAGKIFGTALTLDASKGLVVGGATTIYADGTLTLDGGSITTGLLVNSGGTFAFNSGTLALTTLPMYVRPSGILGDSVVIDGNKILQPVNLEVGAMSDSSLGITGGGTVTVAANATISAGASDNGSVIVSGIGSSLTSVDYMDVGYYGHGALNISGGATATAGKATIAAFDGATGSAIVAGAGSQWTVTGRLDVAGDEAGGPGGTATLEIIDGARLTAAVGMVIHPSGEVRLARGGRIIGGTLSNNGLLSGDGRIDNVLENLPNGEVVVASGEQLTFTDTGNTNAGQITLLGGTAIFQQDLTNQASGVILGNGTLRSDFVTINEGTMAFSATTNVVGDVMNNAAGTIISTGGTTTFFDDVLNDGVIRTNKNSFTVYYGSYSGTGVNMGTGTVIMEADVKPGSSPGIAAFGGDLAFGPTAGLEIEISGLLAGSEFDQITVAGSLDLDGTLNVSLIDGFTLSLYDEFLIADVGGALAGQFMGLGEGSLVGNYNGTDLFVSYQAGDGNDVALLATGLSGDFDFDRDVDGNDFLLWQRDPSVGSLSDWEANYGSVVPISVTSTTVPEPSTFALLILGTTMITTRRRK